MSAGHAHPHQHAAPGTGDYSRAFALGIVLNLGIVIVETVFGLLSGSMALLADAGHNLSDVLGLAVAWGGAIMAKRRASSRFTYGLKKGSILAALINALMLMVAVGAISAEAIRRLFNPEPAHAPTMIWVAALAIVGNLATAMLFARGRKRDLNVRAAYQHMAADAAVSAGVLFAGFIILWTGQAWVDPVMSLAVAGVIAWGTFGLLKESVGMSLMGVPLGISLDDVAGVLGELDGVTAVHDLHVWALSTTETALTAHLLAPQVTATDDLLRRAQAMLHDAFGIAHCTLQIERAHIGDSDC
jgi:cobalt-zinc-cadmium efflux system protein